MQAINHSREWIRCFSTVIPVIHCSQLSTYIHRNVHQSNFLTLAKRHITHIRKLDIEQRAKLEEKIEIAIDQGNADVLMKALKNDGESNLEYLRKTSFFSRMLTKTFSHSDTTVLKILIDADVCSIDLITMMECKTLEQAEIIAQIVGKTQQERNKLLIANAMMREDVKYIQDQLNKNLISVDEFKEIAIPSLYPFQLIVPLNPLLIAISKKNLELVKVLVENGFSAEKDLFLPDFETHLSLSPLTYAYETEAHGIVDYFISKGAKKETKFEMVHYGDVSLKDLRITISYQSEELKKVDRFKLLQQMLNITESEKKD